jgi:hypothetical protein
MRLSFAALVLPCLTAPALVAADFRIETKVYLGEETASTTGNLTLFYQHAVYDFFDGNPREITIYDPRQKHFTLLDVERQVKTRIDQETLLEFVAGIEVRAAKGGALVRESARPKFKHEFDASTKTVVLSGERIRYVAQGQTFADAETERQYKEFADMYARLNSTRVGALPPMARLELNAALAERRLLPVAVTRTLRSQNLLLGETQIARSEHIVTWRLLRSDEERIDKANAQLVSFKAVAFDEFRGIEAPKEIPRSPGS